MVTLRNEHEGSDHRHLTAHWDHDVGLVVEGHDIGPGTAPVSDRGEYEWRYVIPSERVPRLLELLGATTEADLIAVLGDWTGPRAGEFEALTRALRTEFWSW